MKSALAALGLAGLFALVAFAGADAKAPASPAPAAAAAPAASASGPRISVDPASFDFGRALGEKDLTKEFTVRNYGTAELVIEKVSTSCGCTAAFLEGDVKSVKPGGSATLRVTLHTHAGASEMKVMKSVTVRSNDAATPLLEVKIYATVVGSAASSD